MSDDKKITMTSKMVLTKWFELWKEVNKDQDHTNWNRKTLVEMIVVKIMNDDKTILKTDCKASVEKNISQSFRYARNGLIEAYIEKEVSTYETGDLYVAKNIIIGMFKQRLGLNTLTIAVSQKAQGGVKCGKVNGWNLPLSSKSKGKKSIDWIGEFDGLF